MKKLAGLAISGLAGIGTAVLWTLNGIQRACPAIGKTERQYPVPADPLLLSIPVEIHRVWQEGDCLMAEGSVDADLVRFHHPSFGIVEEPVLRPRRIDRDPQKELRWTEQGVLDRVYGVQSPLLP